MTQNLTENSEMEKNHAWTAKKSVSKLSTNILLSFKNDKLFFSFNWNVFPVYDVDDNMQSEFMDACQARNDC